MDWHPFEFAPKDGRLILAANHDAAAQLPAVIYWERGSLAFNIIGHWRSSCHQVVRAGEFTHWTDMPELPKAP
jgi:hypothetical protein